MRDKESGRTKTKFVVDKVDRSDYQRKPDNCIARNHSILHTRALIMGRYGMLKCANNFSSGHGTKKCDLCKVVDDEDHRINKCPKWGGANLIDDVVTFNDI